MILITGGAGFIGSVLAKSLNNIGREDLIICDILDESSKWKNLKNIKFENYINGHELFESEWCDHLNKVTEIHHLGACSTTTERNMDYLFKNNVHYSQKLFELATQKDLPIYYASSAATYGAGEQGYNDDHTCVDSLRPLNPYGYSKQVFDQWVLSRNKTPSTWMGFKFFNVFGPNEYHKGGQRSVVHQAFEQIRDHGEVKLFKSYHADYSDGGQLRDFVYVVDCVKAMLELRDRNAESGIYNLGTGKARSFADLATAAFKAMNKPVNIKYIDMPEELKNQYQYFTEANTEKLTSQLSDFKFQDLESSIADYIKEFLLRPDPYFN